MKPFTGAEEAEDWRLRNCAQCPLAGNCELESALDMAAEADGDIDLVTLARTGLLTSHDGDCLERQLANKLAPNNAARTQLFNG